MSNDPHVVPRLHLPPPATPAPRRRAYVPPALRRLSAREIERVKELELELEERSR